MSCQKWLTEAERSFRNLLGCKCGDSALIVAETNVPNGSFDLCSSHDIFLKKFCDGTAEITTHLIVAPFDSHEKETSKDSIFRVLWKTHASTYFNDCSHREAKALRRALHLNI